MPITKYLCNIVILLSLTNSTYAILLEQRFPGCFVAPSSYPQLSQNQINKLKSSQDQYTPSGTKTKNDGSCQFTKQDPVLITQYKTQYETKELMGFCGLGNLWCGYGIGSWVQQSDGSFECVVANGNSWSSKNCAGPI